MKKKYMKPQMEVVKIQHAQMLCTSSEGYDGRSIIIPGGQVDDENEVF